MKIILIIVGLVFGVPLALGLLSLLWEYIIQPLLRILSFLLGLLVVLGIVAGIWKYIVNPLLSFLFDLFPTIGKLAFSIGYIALYIVGGLFILGMVIAIVEAIRENRAADHTRENTHDTNSSSKSRTRTNTSGTYNTHTSGRDHQNRYDHANDSYQHNQGQAYNDYEEEASYTAKASSADRSIEKYLKILDIEHPLSVEKIKTAYRAKCQEFHPDKHQGLSKKIQDFAKDELIKAGEAREILLEYIGNQ